jgi:uncharacterized membrane protein (UPF0182 family)
LATRPLDAYRRIRRRWVLWLILALAALALVFGAISGFYIDVLWFREVGYSSVFWTRFWSRILLALVFGVAFFVLLYANLLLARRLRPRYRVFSPEEEAIDRYREAFEPFARWALPALSLVFAVFAAAGVAGQWESFQLWRTAGDISFGQVDPLFGRDVSFYLLSLPFQEFVQGWLFASLIVITLVTAGAHYLWGGIRFRSPTERFTPQVKAHLSVLAGLVVLVHAWGYRLGQFDLLVSARGVVTGASYTDVRAQLPALRILVIIALLCAALLIVNIFRRGWALPIVAIGLLVLTSIVAGALVPAFVQRFQVEPQELQREREYIERNIEFTRMAYGLDRVQTRPFPADPTVTGEEVETAQSTIENIRLWNPDIIKASFQQLQRIQPYYEFVDVDVDRYEVDGARRVVMISPREVRQSGIPAGGQTWQNEHLFYTHGYGVVASRVDETTTEGAPSFVASDIPTTGSLAPELERPQMYFQEDSDVAYTVVGARSQELDFPQGEGGGQALTRYDGEGGIQVGGFFRRLAFAWRYRDVNLLISGLITPESRMLINTDLPTRVQKIAPFLSYDHDPYSAIVDGRLVWIWDAYTTSDQFPYSERQNLAVLAGSGSGLPASANYVRNSVKVVVDAFDGTTTLYQIDQSDPIIRAWSQVFPDLLTPLSEASPELREHFRYPEDLFRVQSSLYANYHVTDPTQFYSKGDFWSIPQVPIDPEDPPVPLEPYYVLLPLEEDGESRFLLIQPFTPLNRPNMVSWMAADSDPEAYGQLTSFTFGGRNVRGPGQAAVLMHQDPEVSRETSLLDQRGSNVIYGDLLAIPIGQSFLYVQPLYLQSQQAQEAIPEMKRVVVANGEEVGFAPTLEEAVALSVGEEVVPPDTEEPTEPGEPTGPGLPDDVAALLAEAEQHFERAEAALAEGDLATYEAEIEEAQRLVAQAAELAATPGEADGGG